MDDPQVWWNAVMSGREQPFPEFREFYRERNKAPWPPAYGTPMYEAHTMLWETLADYADLMRAATK